MQHKPIQYRFLESLFSAGPVVWTLAEHVVLLAAVPPVVAVATVAQHVVDAALLADLPPAVLGHGNDVDHPDSRDFDRDSPDYSHSHNCQNS